MNGSFRASGFGDTPARISVVGKQSKTIAGQRFEASRVRIEGYASRVGLLGGSTANGAYFEGEALIDNATGLVLELDLRSLSTAYLVHRELVGLVVPP